MVIRTKEHLSANSAVYDHISQCDIGKNSSIDNFRIVNNGNSDFGIKIREALYIKYNKPSLNNQFFSERNLSLIHI